METAINCLIFVVVIFSFTFSLFDIQKNAEMKQNAFETARAAGQNSLLELQQKYNDYEILSTPMMLEQWLTNFVSQNSLEYKEVTIGFVRIENEPPLYLVTVEGIKNHYAIVSKEAYVSYSSGTLLISEE